VVRGLRPSLVQKGLVMIDTQAPEDKQQYRLPETWINHMEDFYFPINVNQVEDLLGKMLTHVEAMGLPHSPEKANKDLIRQSIWNWFGQVQENSITSFNGCIAPVELPKTPEQKIK
jgi:hypothetical protein